MTLLNHCSWLLYHWNFTAEIVWVTSLPLKRYGFRLNKQQFWDAVCIRYDLPLKDVPKYCQCGQPYSINHCLTCKKGGYVIIRHNTIRDTLAELLGEICKDVVKDRAKPLASDWRNLANWKQFKRWSLCRC